MPQAIFFKELRKELYFGPAKPASKWNTTFKTCRILTARVEPCCAYKIRRSRLTNKACNMLITRKNIFKVNGNNPIDKRCELWSECAEGAQKSSNCHCNIKNMCSSFSYHCIARSCGHHNPAHLRPIGTSFGSGNTRATPKVTLELQA